jgi:hypothetical protein
MAVRRYLNIIAHFIKKMFFNFLNCLAAQIWPPELTVQNAN